MVFSGMLIGSNHIERFTRSIPRGDGITNNCLDCYKDALFECYRCTDNNHANSRYAVSTKDSYSYFILPQGHIYYVCKNKTYYDYGKDAAVWAFWYYPIPNRLATSVQINKSSITLIEGTTETLTSKVLPENTDTEHYNGVVDKTVSWSSNNTSVATVDGAGKVTAVAQGTATITATATNGDSNASNDKKATCKVTVLSINPLTYGGNARQTVSPTFSTESQQVTIATATDGEGTVSYAIASQRQGNTNVDYFTLNASGDSLTLDASTPAGNYTVVVRASATGGGIYAAGTKDSTVIVKVNRADISPTVSIDGWTYGETPIAIQTIIGNTVTSRNRPCESFNVIASDEHSAKDHIFPLI